MAALYEKINEKTVVSVHGFEDDIYIVFFAIANNKNPNMSEVRIIGAFSDRSRAIEFGVEAAKNPNVADLPFIPCHA